MLCIHILIIIYTQNSKGAWFWPIWQRNERGLATVWWFQGSGSEDT